MAFVATHFYLTVTLMDSGRNVTTRRFEMRTDTYTTAVTDAATIIGEIEAVSDAEVLSYGITQQFGENAVSVPAAGVEIEDTALITMPLTDPLKSGSLSIPAPKDAIFVAATGANRNYVDTANVAVVALCDEFKSTGKLYISDGESATGIKAGRRVHRKSNKSRTSRTG